MPWFLGFRLQGSDRGLPGPQLMIALWGSGVLISCLYLSGRAKFGQIPPQLTASLMPIFLLKADRAHLKSVAKIVDCLE